MATLKLVESADQVSRDNAAAAAIHAKENRRLMRERMLKVLVIVCIPVAASGWYAWATNPRIETRIDYITIGENGLPIYALKFENLPPEARADNYVSSVIEYVAMRESYTAMTAERAWQRVLAMSDANVGEEYKTYHRPTNPNSPYRTYGEKGQIKFKYDSHEDLIPVQGYKGLPTGYMVRFCRQEIIDGKPQRPELYGATVRFKRDVPGIDVRQRAEFNPGGIQVTEYPGARRIGGEANVPGQRGRGCVI